MKRIKTFLASSLVAGLLSLSLGCEGRAAPVASPAPAPAVPELPDPTVGSYPASSDASGLEAVSSVFPDQPFPRALDVGASTLDLVFYTPEGSDVQRVFGPVDSVQTSRVDVEAWSAEAWLGRTRYYAPEGNVLVAERTSDEVAGLARERASRTVPEPEARGITLPPKRAAAEGAPIGTSPAVAAPAPSAQALVWRRDVGSPVAAGPIVFDNLVLVATSEPAWVGVDRRSGEILFRRPLDRRLSGPLAYLTEAKTLVALGTDGSVCSFSAPRAPEADPVARFLGPEAAAAERIHAKAAELARVEDLKELPVYLYGARPTLGPDRVALFRYDNATAGTYRIYVDGAGETPVLLALFSAEGEELLSNLEYAGVGQVLVKALEPGAVYYILTADLTEGQVGAGTLSQARLMVVSKR